MTATKEIVWTGPETLRPFLLPINDLKPFPGNPRRGDVAAVRASLRRFGQLRPLVVEGLRTPWQIIAGHHVRLAALEEGWTHVACVANEFENEEEARAFLLADNRTGELGGYEHDLLLSQLTAAREVTLEGTGYTAADADKLAADLARAFAPSEEEPPRLDERGGGGKPDGFEVRLYLATSDQRRDFARHVKLLEREWGVAGATEVVSRAVRDAALAANQS